MVLRSSGVSRSLVVLSSLGCYMQEYRRLLRLLVVAHKGSMLDLSTSLSGLLTKGGPSKAIMMFGCVHARVL
jgi:hypothetical protein